MTDRLADPNFDLVHFGHIRKSEMFTALTGKKRECKWHGPVPYDGLKKLERGGDDSDPDSDDQRGDSFDPDSSDDDHDDSPSGSALTIQASAVRTSSGNQRSSGSPSETRNALERTSARVKSAGRAFPKPLVVVVYVNGQPCRALLDSGSQSDFISTTLVDQLRLPVQELERPLTLQLAVSGSRGKVKCTVDAKLAYQEVSEERTFDVANLDSHDMILGLPFLMDHSAVIAFNPSQVTIRSDERLPYPSEQAVIITSKAAELQNGSF